ncbi:hypothetical protein P154DRAFT_519653 [Amniculicola lignicola CBS 123094]|uniref:Extracellular membrane protein CFEM domain-containing protein n=1 Tax=Amniculicola lignicola CBS 123094 TaxID=1392246 RepID=A0A6A5WQV5_9PLEO|nr:hypothetical protein P154DRAFT_519653 [Amniculicola lignicola CBS 123094]
MVYTNFILCALLAVMSYTNAEPNLRDERLSSVQARWSTLLSRENVNLDGFPECAKPHCSPTEALSPSKLGCNESTLTKECLCKIAVLPLSCVPVSPSSEENCWYEAENWFAELCDDDVPLVNATSMPSCLSDCTTKWLRRRGCRTSTRNCVCNLDSQRVVTAVGECRKLDCMKHMQPKFDVPLWQRQTCTQNNVDSYDEGAYRKRKKLVKTVQIVVPIFVGLAVLLCWFGVCISLANGKSWSPCGYVTLSICVLFGVIPPIFILL